MTHQNYFEIKARNYHELGAAAGEIFSREIRDSISAARYEDSWGLKISQIPAYLSLVRKHFPEETAELEGGAAGAGVLPEEYLALVIEDELTDFPSGRCTTLAGNNGKLVGHNEDWDPSAKDHVCILKRSVGNLTTLDLYYIGTLGGNAVTVNSNGFIQTINSVSHRDHRIGIPKNIVARWFSKTADPRVDYKRFAALKRASGYHHAFFSFDRKGYSLESSAFKAVFSKIVFPFVHTNHYLGDFAEYEKDRNMDFSQTRFQQGKTLLNEQMKIEAFKHLLRHQGKSKRKSIFNNRTIAQAVVDLERSSIWIWLLREKKAGWVEYPLP